MNVGVGQSGIKRKSRRSPLLQTSKNKDMKASVIAFPSDEYIITEGRDEMDYVDSLFNVDDSSSDEENDFETMFAGLIKHKFPFDMGHAHIRAVVEHLQSEVNLDINNVNLQLEDTKILQDQLGWKEKMLNEELKVVKNDMEQYEWYLSDKHYYEFKNDTWDSLINLGRDELQNRRIKLQGMKNDLKNQYQVLHQRMRICHLLLWTLNNEVMRRQQRQHILSVCSHEEVNLRHIIRGEVERLQNIKSLFDMTLRGGMSSMSRVVKNRSSILTEQKLGCTFDFLLHHRVNKGGSVSEYNDVVNIFKKNVPVFESVVNSSKTNRFFENILRQQMSRLEREDKFYLDKISTTSDSQGVNENLSYSLSFSKLNAGNSYQSQPDVPNSSTPSQNRIHTKISSLNREKFVQTYSEVNQRKTQELNNVGPLAEFRNDPTCKGQENESFLISNSQQNGLKPVSGTETEECKNETENRCKKNEMITHLGQDSAIEEKQKHQRECELISEINRTKSTSSTNVKKSKQKKNCSNRYGLRSASEAENVLKLELHSDSEIEVIGHDVVKPVLETDVEKPTQKNNKHQDGNISHHINKNPVKNNKNEVTRLSEGNESVKSLYRNKTGLIKKLVVRMDSLEKLMQETNLELLDIKEGTVAFQRSMDEFKYLLRRNKDCECEMETEICEDGEEERRSELLKSLNIMYLFLKRNDRYKNLIEERELLFSDLHNYLPTDEIELFVLRAARDIQELSLTELKKMETKDLRLKDISKILTSVQDLIQCEEDGYFPTIDTPTCTFCNAYSEGPPI